jgi:hypothetical protein
MIRVSYDSNIALNNIKPLALVTHKTFKYIPDKSEVSSG